MIFKNEQYFHKLSPETGYKWTPHVIKVIDKNLDVQSILSSWPKIVQINSVEFLITGGSRDSSD